MGETLSILSSPRLILLFENYMREEGVSAAPVWDRNFKLIISGNPCDLPMHFGLQCSCSKFSTVQHNCTIISPQTVRKW